jgi:hypothetical protein
MKGITKVLILLALTVLVAGGFYISPTGAEQPKAFPSLGAAATGTPELAITKPGVSGPQKGLSRPTASLGAYPFSTTAVKPAKVEGYQPPHHALPPIQSKQGGDDCASATVIASLPYSDVGTTAGYTNDYDEVCPYSGSTSPDVVYSYTPSSNVVVNIDLYGSLYDTKLYVYQGTCGNAYLVACNDDYYSDYTSAIMNQPLSAGYTYYIVIDGYGGSSGQYVFNLSEVPPCDVTCPPEGVPEGETPCADEYVDTYNGGCNSSPYVFQTINCNTTICGTSGTYLYTGLEYRDTDWFRVVITAPTTLTWSAVAEFPVLIFVMNGGTENCSDYTTLGSATADVCDTATLTFDVQPGVYWLWVGPSVFNSYPCPLDYVAKVTCVEATMGACCNNYDPYDCQLLTPTDCANLADHTFKGLGTNCGPPNPCLPAPDNDECTGAIAVTAPDCPNVVTVDGTTVGANIDCPGVLDWNAVWYSFTLPYATNQLTIDFCPTAIPIYQFGIVLYNSCPVDCGNYILSSGYQWVTCPNGNTGPQVWWSGLPAGTYYFPVAVWDYSMNPFMDFTFTACVEQQQAPANDNCADATPVGDVSNLAFSTSGATFDGPGLCQTAPNVWYCYTATCDGNGYVSVCGSSYDTKIAAYDGCTCPPTTMLACNDDACGGTLQSEISFPVVMGQQYLIEVGGYGTSTGDGVMSISCSQPLPNDDCTGAPVFSTFPQTVSGTTIGAGIDCPGVLDWNAVWYAFVLPYDCNNVDVNFCATNSAINTVGIVLYNSCPPDCPNYILSTGYNWLSCPNGYNNPEVYWYNLPAGTYYFPVFLGTGMDFTFDVTVEECTPCNVECPPGAMPEGEPTCTDDYVDMYNGGCNSSPYVFQTIPCNTTICGTSGDYLYYGSQYRDTDWFRVEVSEGTLTWKAVAEFPVLIFIIDAGTENCSDYTVLNSITANPCDTAVLSQYVPAGVYWLWVGPSVFSGYPCGLEYVATVECTGLGPQIVVTPSSFNQSLEPGQTTDATMQIRNVGSEDLEYEIDYNLANTWLGVSPRFGTIIPAGTDNINIHFDATSVGVGSYDDVLLVVSNSAKDLNDTVEIPVHLEVAYPPDIQMDPTLSIGVMPGCTMEKPCRINNVGLGPLDFSVHSKSGKTGDVLVVDDDNSINYPGDFTDVTSYFTDALTANGYTYDIFEVNTIGGNGPDAATMSAYPAVIWSCGEGWNLSQTLTATDETNLATYLNGGGNLFLSAMDYFYDRYPSAGSFSPGQFPYDYLGVTSVSQDVWTIVNPATGSCVGLSGSVAEGMTFSLWDPYTTKGNPYGKGQDDGLYIDELAFNGTGVFQMTNPAPTGIGACQYEGSGFKTVFTTVDFAGLTDGTSPSTKADFMGAILEWFLGGGCPFTVTPSSGTVPPGGYLDLVLTIDGSAFTECVDETIACDMTINSNDPDEPQVTVTVDMWSGRGDVFQPYCWIDVSDVVYLINYVLRGGPAPNPVCMGDCDPSHDGNIDLADVVYLIQFLFEGGTPPQVTPAAHGQSMQR